MIFNTELCFEKVEIYPIHLANRNRYRMDGAKIYVGKRGKEDRNFCGVLEIEDQSKIQYTVSCNNVCGDFIQIEVIHNEEGISNGGCIHMFEIEAYTAGECPGGYHMKDNVCLPCSEGEYSPGGVVTQCEKCTEGKNSPAGAAAKPSDCVWGEIRLVGYWG
jgi:hypothetical protein